MKTGIILRGVGSFYDVISEGEVFRCRPRGRFRKQRIMPMVGDYVQFEPESDISEGTLEEILPRRNTLIRPAVANIDHLAVVLAAANPEPDLLLVDKLLITAERSGISPLLLINKIDLAEQERLEELVEEYKPTGYPVYCISGKFNIGLDELGRNLTGITTLAGQSGVGKSSIINKLRPDTELETGDVSKKIKRGRHTTRHVELLTLPGGGMIVDTPGFSQMDLMDFEPAELQESYPEFEEHWLNCRFSSCLHVTEPGCAVRQAVETGEISKGRYDRYIRLVEEIRENRRNVW
jgi:ribosome biogenesis GTPase